MRHRHHATSGRGIPTNIRKSPHRPSTSRPSRNASASLDANPNCLVVQKHNPRFMDGPSTAAKAAANDFALHANRRWSTRDPSPIIVRKGETRAALRIRVSQVLASVRGAGLRRCQTVLSVLPVEGSGEVDVGDTGWKGPTRAPSQSLWFVQQPRWLRDELAPAA